MKITKPYELLIRFGIEGTVSGAHAKTQSYYMDGLLPDLATWREDQATTADLESPLIKKWCGDWSVALYRDCTALRERVAALEADIHQRDEEIEKLKEVTHEPQ